ncbi:ribonuclease 3 domain protein [Mycobacterium kansasii]|uniref:Ribonuclease 3 domain protein n=1 Tax=Mycobacterium kansasii TaxID=1768 RepID=A0A1V3XYI6_MYCKA|nr:ribonuclease 3 domain protein [Mycobacterium kansasii]
MTASRQSLLDALGVDLSDELLSLALTHRSYAYENGGYRPTSGWSFSATRSWG